MTLHTAVVGRPISHSLSPCLHNAIYAHEGIDAKLRAFDETDIAAFVQKIRNESIEFVAVTLPHKQTIMPLLDAIDDAARDIGAVNTVINRAGILTGYNTDIVGIAAALKDVSLEGKAALILGAGGAAQAVAYHLRAKGAHIYCYNKGFEKAKEFCARFGGMPIERLPYVNVKFDLIVNATPVGLKATDQSPIPDEIIQNGAVVFDLVYTPTNLQKAAYMRGASVITGLSMFLAQGLEQEKLWLGREILDSGYTALLQAELAMKKYD